MMTGDGAVNRDAPIICCTAEILANMALREATPRVDAVVMDEFHYYADRERGVAWQIPLLLLEKATFLLMSATLGDIAAIAEALARAHRARGRGGARDDAARCRSTSIWQETPLHETIEELVEAGPRPGLPGQLHAARRGRGGAEPDERQLLARKEEKDGSRRRSTASASTPPTARSCSASCATASACTTPACCPSTGCSSRSWRSRGCSRSSAAPTRSASASTSPSAPCSSPSSASSTARRPRSCAVRDFQQIAGRAGRKGFDDRGYVVAQAPEHVIENKRSPRSRPAGKKVVKKKPPAEGLRPLGPADLRAAPGQGPRAAGVPLRGDLRAAAQPAPERDRRARRRLRPAGASSSRRSHGTDVHAARGTGGGGAAASGRSRPPGWSSCARVDGLPGRHVRPAERAAARLLAPPHALALPARHAPAHRPREPETYALDVLTLVESILENPDAVLWKQLDRARGETVAAHEGRGRRVRRADGGAREGRVPQAQPRVHLRHLQRLRRASTRGSGSENIRPKSIAREMVERFMSFNDYVREYELQRSEGVLLRYLSEVYKTLVQTVPETLPRRGHGGRHRLPADHRARRRLEPARRVGAHARRAGAGPSAAAAGPEPPRPRRPSPSTRPPISRGFAARVRTELHRLLARWRAGTGRLRRWSAQRPGQSGRPGG